VDGFSNYKQNWIFKLFLNAVFAACHKSELYLVHYLSYKVETRIWILIKSSFTYIKSFDVTSHYVCSLVCIYFEYFVTVELCVLRGKLLIVSQICWKWQHIMCLASYCHNIPLYWDTVCCSICKTFFQYQRCTGGGGGGGAAPPRPPPPSRKLRNEVIFNSYY
jgi:hypothetical protein